MGLTTVRYVLPAVLVIAGFVILFVADGALKWEGWAMCVGSGLALLLLNVLFRYGAEGDKAAHRMEVQRQLEQQLADIRDQINEAFRRKP